MLQRSPRRSSAIAAARAFSVRAVAISNVLSVFAPRARCVVSASRTCEPRHEVTDTNLDPMTSPFTTKTLSFLRSLKRNNDRDWFRSRKQQYEQHVRAR